MAYILLAVLARGAEDICVAEDVRVTVLAPEVTRFWVAVIAQGLRIFGRQF